MNHNRTVTVFTEIRQVAHTLSQPARAVRFATMAHQQVHPGHYEFIGSLVLRVMYLKIHCQVNEQAT